MESFIVNLSFSQKKIAIFDYYEEKMIRIIKKFYLEGV